MLEQGFSTDFFPGVFPRSYRKSQVSHLLEEVELCCRYFKHGKDPINCEIPKPRLELGCFNNSLTEKKKIKNVYYKILKTEHKLKHDFLFFS